MPVYRGEIIHCLDDPRGAGRQGRQDAIAFHEDGALWVSEGANAHVIACADWSQVAGQVPEDCQILDWRGSLLLPGFVDCHVHYPQTGLVASHGSALLDWLTRYTFPAELRFHDAAFARQEAEFFLDQCLANGVTAALVFATSHANSVEAIFSAAFSRNMRIISGQVWMDESAPEGLCVPALQAASQTSQQIKDWHHKGRLGYAITPRFAPTSSRALLTQIGGMLSQYDDVLLHTHLAENADEIALVGQKFPDRRDYLDVYAHFGLLGARSVFAHCLHLSPSEWGRLQAHDCGIAFCPGSNFFLGSGVFDLETARAHKIRMGLGSDVGAGTSLSPFQSMGDAYRAARLRNADLDAYDMLYLATLGGAKTLHLDKKIGNFLPGKEADFIRVDPRATPWSAHRIASAQDLHERLFALMLLGDERMIEATYVAGHPAFIRHQCEGNGNETLNVRSQ